MANEYDITEAFAAIERELINSMFRNIKSHKLDEAAEKKEWTQWQMEELKALERYKVQNQKKYSKKFRSINNAMEEMIKLCNEYGGMDQEREIAEAIKNGFKGFEKVSKSMQGEFFKLNERKLDALIKATIEDAEKAERAILRMANDKYRSIIFNAQVYANTGAGTYEQAIDMASKDFLSAGLNCVEYKNGARHKLSDYISMALRTANKRAYLYGEGEKRQEWGISTVIMNKRGNPCPLCLPWVGKVLIDDVWSGGSAKDGPYPLLSTAMAAGLYHPNCRDSHTTYFEGISTPPDDKFTREEIEEIKEEHSLEQKKSIARRNYERYTRLAENSLDENNKKAYESKAEYWRKEYGLYHNHRTGAKREKSMYSKGDVEQYERYRNVLGNNVPEKLEDFLEIKYNNKTEYGKLKHSYRIANQYENNSGKMDPMKVVELHDAAVEEKALFTSDARKKANIGIMELDGERFFANSSVDEITDPGYYNFKGKKEKLILKPSSNEFEATVVGTHLRDVDSEYKLFEYAASVAKDGKPHKIQLLSEKVMCKSCRGVMEQFKKKYPNVEVEVVSHRADKAKKHHNHNPVFEYDAKKEYEDANG